MIGTENAEKIISQVYKGILGREADPDGLKYYSKRLSDGIPFENLLSEFVSCDEFSNLSHKNYIIDVESAKYWWGFGQQDIEYIKKWQQDDLIGEQGFLTDFVDVRTRISSLWRQCAQYDGTVISLPIPMDYHADILEYVGTLRAVDAAKGSLAVMELGAGMGPWIVTAAVAARRKGIKDIYFCAIEGDPIRHELMLQHIRDNALQDYPQEIIQGAVGVEDGEALWPRLAEPQNQSSARPMLEGNEADAEYLAHQFDLSDMIRVPFIAFHRLLDKRALWDLIHIDVQGTEAELCKAAIDTLTERARYIVVGTHSRKLDGELIEIFHGAGWILENEKPAIIKYDHSTPHQQMTINDGTQIWRNPNL